MPFTEPIPNPVESGAPAASGGELCPLSSAQERLWFLDQLQPGNPAYNIPQGWRLEGELNFPAFQESVNEVIRRHETLRTTFGRMAGKPVEIISAFQPVKLKLFDVSGHAAAGTEARRLIDAAAREPFDLQQGPLFTVQIYRVSICEHLVLFNLHHIIADAWSFEVVRREISAVYAAAVAGQPFQLPELPVQYLDYARWQREQTNDETSGKALDFWKEHLAGELPRLELPYDASPAAPTAHSRSVSFALSTELVGLLKSLARQEGATFFTVLLTAFNVFLHRITGQNDLIVGTPVSGRDQAEIEGLIGIFVNTIALRTGVRDDPTFRELLAQVRETTFGAFAHQEVPFETVVKTLQPERAPGQNPLFQVVLALHGGYPAQWAMGDLHATILEVETQTAKFDWTFLLEETECGIKGRLEYKTDLFTADTIRRLLGNFHLLLEGIVKTPDQKISLLPLLTTAEQQQLLVDWNQTHTRPECDASIHTLFEAQVEKAPEAIALVSGDEQVTYRELNQRANQLARRLKKSGVGPESLVGFCLDRSPDMIIALLAILKAGGAYVPLDRTLPRERLSFMISDTRLSLLLTGSDFDRTILPDETPQVICIDQGNDHEAEAVGNLAGETTANHLAYVMYTSGSTGTPKGTLIPHRGVVRLVRNPNYVTLSPVDVFLQLAPVSFDASTFEIWGCLLNGAKLVLFPPHIPSLEELGRTIEQHQVTTLWLTAGLFHQMADRQLMRMKSVRQLLAGGDVLSVPHVVKTIGELPGCHLINGYGPTENTTFTCCYRVPKDWAGGKSVPIGKPVSNTDVYVLDEHGSPVPIGVTGELYAGGDGLARGYLNRPELDREKFVCAPPQVRRPVAGKLYRTGDRARWLPDGNLEFLGRKDQQVKIRGFRIELGEIEAVLSRHPTVNQAVVIARKSLANDRELIAYVTINPGSLFDEPGLRQFLKNKLPAYMLPSHIVELAALPLTVHGKVDLRALPVPEVNAGANGPIPPRGPTEDALCKIWREVLERDSFGVHDNFFQLGGHSLLATQVISRIARTLLVELPVRAVFEAPTIAELAEKIHAAPPVSPGLGIVSRRAQRTEARQLLAQIDRLSEVEIDSLLSRPN